MNTNLQRLFSIANRSERLAIGLMSGTSLDGLDIALCRINGFGIHTRITLEAFQTIEYSPQLKTELLSIFAQQKISLEKLCLLNTQLAIIHANSILNSLQQWQIQPKEIDFIASHGQTIFHAPKVNHPNDIYPNATLQIGDGDHIAVKTGIITISDFRQKHVAAGGEGAPLVAYGDYLLFRSTQEDRTLLNIGGIANLTYLPNKQTTLNSISSDIGPGNTLINHAATQYFNQPFDNEGKIAQSAQINQALLQKLLQHPFFNLSFPKTTGPELFNWEFVEQALQEIKPETPENIVATLTQFTAEAISLAIKKLHAHQATLYISGGGVKNITLVNAIQQALPTTNIKPFEQLGINPDAKEAVLFALLANEALMGEPISIANNPTVLMGKISFPK